MTDFDLFLGRDYLITVQEGECPSLRETLDQLRSLLPITFAQTRALS